MKHLHTCSLSLRWQFFPLAFMCAFVGMSSDAISQELSTCISNLNDFADYTNPWAQIENESCVDETNSQLGNSMNSACAEILQINQLTLEQQFAVYGFSESSPDTPLGEGTIDTDDYVWVVPEAAWLFVNLYGSHQIDYKLSIFSIENPSTPCSLELYTDCEFCSPDDQYLPDGLCTKGQARWVDAGTYIIRVIGSHSENLGCGEFQYYLLGGTDYYLPYDYYQDLPLDWIGFTWPIVVENHYAESNPFPQADYGPEPDRYCAAADIDQDDISVLGGKYAFEATSYKSIITFHSTGMPDFDGIIGLRSFPYGMELGCFNNFGPNEKEVLIVDTEPGGQYSFNYYENTRSIPLGSPLQLNVTQIPRTELRTSDCGRMDLVNSSILRSNWPLNRSNLSSKVVRWRFKFEELEAPFNTYEVLSPNGNNPQFRWQWFPQRQPGRTYKVWTQVLMQPGPTWSDYGTFCIIGTAGASGNTAIIAQDEPSVWGTDFEDIQSVELWPNPSNNDVTLRIYTDISQESVEVTIYDARGIAVDRINQPLSGAGYVELSRPTQQLASGVYFVHIRSELGTTTKKLIVKHE